MIKIIYIMLVILITYGCASSNEKDILLLKKEILELQAKMNDNKQKKKKEEPLFEKNTKSVLLPQINKENINISYKTIKLDEEIFFLFNKNGNYSLKVGNQIKEASLSINSSNKVNSYPEDLFFIQKDSIFISKGYPRNGKTSFKLILKTNKEKKMLYNFEITL